MESWEHVITWTHLPGCGGSAAGWRRAGSITGPPAARRGRARPPEESSGENWRQKITSFFYVHVKCGARPRWSFCTRTPWRGVSHTGTFSLTACTHTHTRGNKETTRLPADDGSWWSLRLNIILSLTHIKITKSFLVKAELKTTQKHI